jgi:hypothetical protein
LGLRRYLIMAAQEITGWDAARARTEFQIFKAWYLEKNIWSHNWMATWKKWCSRDLVRGGQQQTHGRPDGRTRTRDKAAEAIQGSWEWLTEEQGYIVEEDGAVPRKPH